MLESPSNGVQEHPGPGCVMLDGVFQEGVRSLLPPDELPLRPLVGEDDGALLGAVDGPKEISGAGCLDVFGAHGHDLLDRGAPHSFVLPQENVIERRLRYRIPGFRRVLHLDPNLAKGV